MKVICFIAIALLGPSLAFPGFDAKDVMRLVATVDPKTCNCVREGYCNIEIPYASVLGISCNDDLQFCCSARKRIKAFVTAQDMAEIHAAAKRLKVSSQVQQMVANADTLQVESAVAQLQDHDEELIKINENADPETVQEGSSIHDNCQCTDYTQCSEDKMDFTFGKSCSYGKVRCCINKTTTTFATTTTKEPMTTTTTTSGWMVTKRPAKTFIRYSVPSMIEKTPQVLSLDPKELAEKVKQNARPLMYNHGVKDEDTKLRAQNRVANVEEERNNDSTEEKPTTFADPFQAQREAYYRYLQQKKYEDMREEWRRRTQPTLMERVADIFGLGSWIR